MEFDLSKVELSNYDKKRGLILPKEPSKELAEFMGILTGDGHVSFNTKRNIIEIAGDSRLDHAYLEKHVKPIIKRLFNLDVKVKKRNNQNTSTILFSSQGLFQFIKSLGYYKHKSKKIKIPSFILNEDSLKPSFIRGLGDTDFSLMLYRNRKKYPHYPILSLGSASKNLRDFVYSYMTSLGFFGYIMKEKMLDKRTKNIYTRYSVRLSGRQNLELWMKLIGFNNPKHLNKYKEYLKSGKIIQKIGRPSKIIKELNGTGGI